MSHVKSALAMVVALGALLWLCPGEIRGQDLQEACCLPGGGCAMVPAGTCVTQGGFLAPGGVCLGDANQNGVDDACEIVSLAEACCPPDGRCYMELPARCREAGGEPKGPGSVCVGDNDGDGLDDVCEGGPLKFIQPPDINKTGIDVRATQPLILADDFKCDRRSLITHITVWGSWLNDVLPGVPGGMPDPGNVVFTLSLHADIPAGPNVQYSRPGKVVWMRTFAPGSFTVAAYRKDLQEWWWDPRPDGLVGGDSVCWQYDFWIPATEAFCQEGTPNQPIVYWLDVQAQVPTGSNNALFGWKTSIHHWNDAAVWGVGAEPFSGPWNRLTCVLGDIWLGEAIDLAFAIEGDQPCEAELDWGDAPDPTYPTLAANLGANHVIVPGLMLGNLIDAEADGQPDPTATGDDLNNLPDEDGVTFNTALFSNVPNTVSVTVTHVTPLPIMAYLNAWIDFNGNGSWADPGEQIFTDVIVNNGVNNLTFVPGAITATGKTFARFRLSTLRGLPFTGPAPDGEVEDYLITIAPVKWIQPPDPEMTGVDVDNFWVQLADDFMCTQTGPITDFHIWTSFNGDVLPPDGLNSLAFVLHLYADVPADPAGNFHSHPGELLWSAVFEPGQYKAGLCTVVPGEWWFDPATNAWHFPGDTRIYQYDFYVNENDAFRQREGTIYWLGMEYLSQTGTDCALGWKTSYKHWNDDACWLDPSGAAPTWRELRYGDGHPMAGESMDLAFAVTGVPGPVPDIEDFGDAPAPYPTLLAANGARHVAVRTLKLGNLLDTEPNGLPNPTATGDDTTNLADEDGVTFNTALFSGVPNTVTVTVTNLTSVAAYLNAWVDFNGNGSWADAGEQIFTDVIVSNGVNNLVFVPGAITATGQTFARYRLSTQQGLSFTGPAPNGEVEDYLIKITPVKWLQPPDVNWTGVDVDNFWVQLADDFKCTQTGPITDFHIWTSFKGDVLPPNGLNALTFALYLYADVPADPAAPLHSHPGELLWSAIFGPGQYNAGFCSANPDGEWWFDPASNFWHFPGDHRIYQYDFYVDAADAFRQQEGTIYWLGVKYISETGTDCALGWKTSLRHWNDDACWLDPTGPAPIWRELRYGDNHPMAPDSIDLAFAVTGIAGPGLDFGDAPPPYPTLLAANGARHIATQVLMLGNLIDSEANGLPNPTATGDDITNLADEDGVTFNTALFSGVPNTVTVNVTNTTTAIAYLNAWIDFDGNGSWADPGEQIFTDVGVGSGTYNLTFVPGAITATGQTFARFRLSFQQGLSFTGLAPNGEVEDYMIKIAPVKWLQRPDVHTTGVDVDNATALLADDFKCTMSGPITDIHIWTSFLNDILPPNGLTSLGFTLTLHADIPAAPPHVPYSRPGIVLWKKHFAPGQYKAGLCLNERAEWWHNPATQLWRFPGDTQIYQYDFYITEDEAFRQREGTVYWLGMKYDAVDPEICRLGWKSSLEHWNDDACYLDPTGTTPYWKELRYGDNHPMAKESMDLAFALTGIPGEVPPTDDFGDAPDPTYPTLLGNNGARHTVVPGYLLGNLIDAEADGQPNAAATGDDLANLADEDGVVFRNVPLTPGQLACVDVIASASGFLNAWLDFDGNGSWANAGEQIFTDVLIGPGVNTLTFPVPITAAGGRTFARFRFSTAMGLSYVGAAPDGEIEDYVVSINPTPPGVLEVFPADDLLSEGDPGGPFVPGSKVYTLTNTGGQAINWSAANLQPWVTVSPPLVGPLAPGASTNVTVSINALANALPAGTYNDTVTFANTTNGNIYTLAANENFAALPSNWQIFPFAIHKLPEGVVRLVSTGFISKAGSAFFNQPLKAVPGNSKDFEVSFDFKLANVSGHYADAAGNIDPDGLTMVVNGAPTGPFYQEGIGIGYRDFPTKSFAVEFDGYMNSFDPDSNHVGVDLGGYMVSATTAAISPDFEDTGVWHAVVRFQNGVLNVVVTPPGLCPIHAIQNYTIPAANIPDVKYIGFTSAAGGNSADTDIDNVVIKVFDQGGTRNVILKVHDHVSPVITAAVSRKTHGLAGNFDIDLLAPLAGLDVAVECRYGGPTQVLATFDEPIQGSGPGGTPQTTDVTVVDTAGSAISISAVSIAGNVLTIDMSGVANASRATIRFPGISDLSGNISASSVCLGVLCGDTDGDGKVNVIDLITVRNLQNKPVTATTFRCDVVADGGINVLDLITVRNLQNTVLPPPPCP